MGEEDNDGSNLSISFCTFRGKKKERQGLKMQLCFAKIIYELGCHEIPKFHAQIQTSSVSA